MRRHYHCRVLSRQAGDIILPAGQSHSSVYINACVWDAFELALVQGREQLPPPVPAYFSSEQHKEGDRQGGLDNMCEAKEGNEC